MTDYENEYLLINEDGSSVFTDKKPNLDHCSWPIKFRISEISETTGYVLEKLSINNEWEEMEYND